MSEKIKQMRLWLGSKLVCLGFFIAPDAYWIAFATGIVDAKLDERDAEAALAEYNTNGGKPLEQLRAELNSLT